MNRGVAGVVNAGVSATEFEVNDSITSVALDLSNMCIDLIANTAVGFYIHYKHFDCGDLSTCLFKVKILEQGELEFNFVGTYFNISLFCNFLKKKYVETAL